jgi:hypothetical protein
MLESKYPHVQPDEPLRHKAEREYRQTAANQQTHR